MCNYYSFIVKQDVELNKIDKTFAVRFKFSFYSDCAVCYANTFIFDLRHDQELGFQEYFFLLSLYLMAFDSQSHSSIFVFPFTKKMQISNLTKEMDPWSVDGTAVTKPKFLYYNDTAPDRDILAFEDNFKPSVYDRLPDSEEYLAILGKQETVQKRVIQF